LKIPADLPPASVVPAIDTREQLPLDLPSLAPPVITTLATGDYSVIGLTNVIAIERKSLDDLLASVGAERSRFDREIQRLLAYPVRCLVIESGWQALERGEWRSKVTPQAAVGSVLGWMAAGLPVCMCYTHERAGKYVARLLYTAARRRWREARELVAFVQGEQEPEGAEVAQEAATA
jgi:DNA excision repair protein ERCC-4